MLQSDHERLQKKHDQVEDETQVIRMRELNSARELRRTKALLGDVREKYEICAEELKHTLARNSVLEYSLQNLGEENQDESTMEHTMQSDVKNQPVSSSDVKNQPVSSSDVKNQVVSSFDVKNQVVSRSGPGSPPPRILPKPSKLGNSKPLDPLHWVGYTSENNKLIPLESDELTFQESREDRKETLREEWNLSLIFLLS